MPLEYKYDYACASYYLQPPYARTSRGEFLGDEYVTFRNDMSDVVRYPADPSLAAIRHLPDLTRFQVRGGPIGVAYDGAVQWDRSSWRRAARQMLSLGLDPADEPGRRPGIDCVPGNIEMLDQETLKPLRSIGNLCLSKRDAEENNRSRCVPCDGKIYSVTFGAEVPLSKSTGAPIPAEVSAFEMISWITNKSGSPFTLFGPGSHLSKQAVVAHMVASDPDLVRRINAWMANDAHRRESDPGLAPVGEADWDLRKRRDPLSQREAAVQEEWHVPQYVRGIECCKRYCDLEILFGRSADPHGPDAASGPMPVGRELGGYLQLDQYSTSISTGDRWGNLPQETNMLKWAFDSGGMPVFVCIKALVICHGWKIVLYPTPYPGQPEDEYLEEIQHLVEWGRPPWGGALPWDENLLGGDDAGAGSTRSGADGSVAQGLWRGGEPDDTVVQSLAGTPGDGGVSSMADAVEGLVASWSASYSERLKSIRDQPFPRH